MTGYGDSWGSWTTHPLLLKEWSEFETVCSERGDHSDFSKHCYKLLNPPLNDAVEFMDEDGADEIACGDISAENSLSLNATQEEHFSQASQLTPNGMVLLSQDTEDHDVDSLVMELNEVLESQNIPLPDDLLSALSELPAKACPQLLKRLREDLTENGLHTLYQLASDCVQESLEQSGWLHPALVCKYIILPKVTGDEECPNELCVVLEEYARLCPKIVISQILHPILENEHIQRDLVHRVTSTLPAKHHLKLLKYVLDRCETPLLVAKINILMTLLEAVSLGLNQVLKQLMALLEKSADSLATNEQFANLLLIVVRRLPPNTAQSVRDALASIVRQNKSFNKQLLLNSLKENR